MIVRDKTGPPKHDPLDAQSLLTEAVTDTVLFDVPEPQLKNERPTGYTAAGNSVVACVASWSAHATDVEITMWGSYGNVWMPYSGGGIASLWTVTWAPVAGEIALTVGQQVDVGGLEDQEVAGVVGWCRAGVAVEFFSHGKRLFRREPTEPPVSFFAIPLIGNESELSVFDVDAKFIE